MCTSTPSVRTPAPPPPPPETPELPDVAGSKSAQADRRRRGRASTLLTGPQGVTNGAATSGATLLGA